jgi:sensor c-di-GMP phosphodiesterase-like protein
VDILKIDLDFIRNLGESAGRPVMDAIISLSKALGLTTVAEGIEDLGQAAEQHVEHQAVEQPQGVHAQVPPAGQPDGVPQPRQTDLSRQADGVLFRRP